MALFFDLETTRCCSCISEELSKRNGIWSQVGSGIQTPLPGCVALDKWLDLSGPQQMGYSEEQDVIQKGLHRAEGQ